MTRRHPAELRKRLVGIAGAQAGYFTARQALDAGYSYASQRYHTENGDWRRISRGIFRLTDWPIGPHDHLVRWTLWSAGEAVVSHDTALSLADLGDFDPARVHLTVPPGFRRKLPDGVVLHHDDLLDDDVEIGEGYRVTTPLRTLLDVADDPGTNVELLASAIHDALERGLLTRRALQERAELRGPQAALNVERALGGGAF